MSRNILKSIEQGKILLRKHQRADFTVGEIDYFYNMFNQKLKEAQKNDLEFSFPPATSAFILTIIDVFCFGVAVGSRNNK